MSEQHGKTGSFGDLVLIGKYLRTPATAEQPNCAANLQLLLDAILRWGLYPEQPGLKPFADDLRQVTRQFESNPTSGEAGAVIEATAALLGQHRKVKDDLDKKQLDEIHEMVVMFHRSVAALSQGSHRSVDRLSTLERDLRGATGLSDLMALRGRLNSVLDYVRKEREEERAQSTKVTQMLEQEFQAVQTTLLECGVGMPGREQAIAALKRAWMDHAVGALVRLDQTRQIAERHGEETTQRLMLSLLGAVSRQIPVAFAAFQWRSDALLLLFERTEDCKKLRKLIQEKITMIPVAFMVEVASRKTLFRCPHKWLMVGSDEEPDEAKALARFELFLRA